MCAMLLPSGGFANTVNIVEVCYLNGTIKNEYM